MSNDVYFKRTEKQNNALHLYCEKLAIALNDAGKDQRVILKPGISIPWTKEAIKEQLWKPVQEVIFNKKSTAELTKEEVSMVWEILNRHLGTRFGVYVPFPSEETRNEDVYF